MFQRHFVCNFLCNSFIILQLLSCNAKAKWKNNHTLIKIINGMNTTWTAGENNMLIPDKFNLQKLKSKGLPILNSEPVRTPHTFDARKHWKHCRRIIRKIRNQGNCDSCWAVAAASMLSDRTCIATNGSIRVHLSAEDITTCCDTCARVPDYSCGGGRLDDPVYFWIREGIVTGGEFDSKMGCKPYSKVSFREKGHLPCTRHCSNKRHYKQYEEDKYKGRMVYTVAQNEEAMRTEIFNHGPLVVAFVAFSDFLEYRKGVYQHVAGIYLGGHAAKILGWGEESGKKYWLVANSFGVEYGWKGYLKILRGENHCEIESWIIAGRMYNSLPAGDTLREAAVSRQIKRRFCSTKQLLFYAFCVCILKELLYKDCLT